jgi:uncharacterized Fe-S cluster protein YjdI
VVKAYKYTNGEITVPWDKEVCIHSAKCVNSLKSVFNPEQKPWINILAAPGDEIIRVVNNCPSGALKFIRNEEMEESKQNEQLPSIKIAAGGPYLVKGGCVVIDKGGTETIKEGPFALCRCGHSQNKPYCDGSHKKVEFDK